MAYNAHAQIIINEIMTADKDSTKNEFIELYNTSDAPIILDKYSLKKKTASGSESALVASTKFFGTIARHGYFVIAFPDYLAKIKGDLAYSSSSYSIADDNTILLYDDNGKLLDKVGYGSAKDSEGDSALNPTPGKSIGRTNNMDTEDNHKDFTAQNPTPGKENELLEINTPGTPKVYSDQIEINEILPHPKNGEQEFIELYNAGKSDEDLVGWTLHDASKTGEYKFDDHTIVRSKDFLTLFKDLFKFSLNDSGQETITLRDGSGNIISEVAYTGSKEGASYNFDGSAWHWSKLLSPGKENIFENAAKGTLNIDSEVYVDVYADFSIEGLSDISKVTWDFGDGHKSYLAKTRHKYAKVGQYNASVTYTEGSEDEIENFVVDVKEIDHPKIRIIAISANPKGNDENSESITLENKTRKKINLLGWSIATGWKKKYINHPIREELIIKGKKQGEITAEVSSFALNNKQAKVQLRYPDGEVAHEVKYKKAEGISEGEKYVKIKNVGWQWIGTTKNQEITAENRLKQATDDNQMDENRESKEKDLRLTVNGSENKNTKTAKEIKPTKEVDIKMFESENLGVKLFNHNITK